MSKGDTRVARRYAQALFATAKQYDVVKAVEEDLAGIANLIYTDERFRAFMLSPIVGREEKIAIADRIFSDRITALTMHLLRLTLEKGREAEFEAIRQHFITLRREDDSILAAVFTSAEMLEEAQKNALITKLEQVSGKRVEGEFKIDPHLIGGVKVAYGNNVLDGSLRGSLGRLKQTLRYDLLKQN